ncbi:MAG: hypothetical protein ACI8Z1_003616 [Candidatus Azotimanducaceae bacterium]
MTRFIALSFAPIVFLMGCAVQSQTTPRELPAEINPIEVLLEQAGSALQANRLTTPRSMSAYHYYQQVLLTDPNNSLAKNGINSIVETYLAWALDDVDQGKLSRARQYVTKAESIDHKHPNIKPVVARINDREEARVVRYTIETGALRQRDASRIDLDGIADEITRRKGFLTIHAPNDPSGRWLYQQLNERVPFRIEAKFERSSAPLVMITH